MFYFKSLILLLLLSLNLYADLDFVVVVSKDTSIDKLSKKQISKLFLSKSKSFPNGQRAIPIEIKNSDFKEFFYKTVSNKNSKQLLKYWAKVIFTGKGIPPKNVLHNHELFTFMLNNKNSITYIKREHLTDSLKIVWEKNSAL